MCRRRLPESDQWAVRAQGTTDPEETTGWVSLAISAPGHPDKMTLGVTYEGALGKPAS